MEPIDDAPALENRARAVRSRLGMSQTEVASRAGLSRQTLSAIEAGRMMPSVRLALQLAEALECRVEDLFRKASEPTSVVAETEVLAPAIGQRVAAFFVAGRWVTHALPARPSSWAQAADGVVRRYAGRRAAELTLLTSERHAAERLLLVGCAPALGVLSDRARTAAHLRVAWLPFSSLRALDALRERRAHVAGVHLVDDAGKPNASFVRAALGATTPTRLFTLATWHEGFVVKKGNPRGIFSAEDLLRSDLTIVAREPGAAAQLVLERLIRGAGGDPAQRLCDSPCALGHDDVAQRVAFGPVDVGLAAHTAALAYGLDFVPLLEERIDLVLTTDTASEARTDRLLDVLTSSAFRRDLAALGGYDTARTGELVSELS